MPRDLKKADNNKATFADGVSGGEVSLYYRTPTNSERISFRNACVTRKGKNIIDQSTEAQLSYGARILSGIEDGDFVNGDNPVSSNKDSEHYDPDWKKLVLETGGDLIQSLALLAFSGVVLKYDGPEQDDSEVENVLDMSEIPGLEESAIEPGDETEEEDIPDPLE